MQLSTLVYLKKDNHYLMLHRIKKQHDINEGKWIGVGGKLEAGEDFVSCMKREVKEETGLNVNTFRNCGMITFIYNHDFVEHIALFECEDFSGTLISDCNEGILQWIPINKLHDLNLWQGDHIFLDLMQTQHDYFYLTLVYENDNCVSVSLNGLPLELKNYLK